MTDTRLAAVGVVRLGIAVRGADRIAEAEARARVVAKFPEDSHAPIVYRAAVTAVAASVDADIFMEFLRDRDRRRAP